MGLFCLTDELYSYPVTDAVADAQAAAGPAEVEGDRASDGDCGDGSGVEGDRKSVV